MPFWSRAKPEQAILDPMMSLRFAVGALATELGFTATGAGSLCFRPVDGHSFQFVQDKVNDRLDRDTEKTGPTEITEDSYGFRWILAHRRPDQFKSLVDDLYAASLEFSDSGFGSQLLCAVTALRGSDERRIGIVYLYRRGTFYPFAPRPKESRDNKLELRIREVIQGWLPFEPDLKKWFPLWDAPGL
jgi:hypothetical protein